MALDQAMVVTCTAIEAGQSDSLDLLADAALATGLPARDLERYPLCPVLCGGVGSEVTRD